MVISGSKKGRVLVGWFSDALAQGRQAAQLLLLVLCSAAACAGVALAALLPAAPVSSPAFPGAPPLWLLLPFLSASLFLLLSSLSSLLPAALLSLLCFFHSQTSMLKNTGLIDCIKARELHRPEAGEIFHVGLLVRSAALVLLLQSEADRLLSYLLAHLLSAAGRKFWARAADADPEMMAARAYVLAHRRR